jgi:PHD finger protein 20
MQWNCQVSEKYVCIICKNPLRARQSQKYIHDQDWLLLYQLLIIMFQIQNKRLLLTT